MEDEIKKLKDDLIKYTILYYDSDFIRREYYGELIYDIRKKIDEYAANRRNL